MSFKEIHMKIYYRITNSSWLTFNFVSVDFKLYYNRSLKTHKFIKKIQSPIDEVS